MNKSKATATSTTPEPLPTPRLGADPPRPRLIHTTRIGTTTSLQLFEGPHSVWLVHYTQRGRHVASCCLLRVFTGGWTEALKYLRYDHGKLVVGTFHTLEGRGLWSTLRYIKALADAEIVKEQVDGVEKA